MAAPVLRDLRVALTAACLALTADFLLPPHAAADTGFISQNVYLFRASEGLATVVYAWIDREALAEAMGLSPGQRIVLAQSVGWPP